jgi:hypothetical protein
MNDAEVKINQRPTQSRRAISGQVAVEYILLLIVGVTVWLMLISQLVSRNPQTPGPIIRVWVQLLNFVASDQIENVQPPQ